MSEALTDSGVDIARCIAGYMATAGGEAVGNALGAYLVTGTASSRPQGIASAASLGTTTAGAIKYLQQV